MQVLLLSLFFIVSGMGVAFADPISAQTSSEDKTHFVDEQIMIMADISNNQEPNTSKWLKSSTRWNWQTIYLLRTY